MSFSKKRHILESNILLENRFLTEQNAPQKTDIQSVLNSIVTNIRNKNSKGIVSDYNKLQTRQDLIDLNNLYAQTYQGQNLADATRGFLRPKDVASVQQRQKTLASIVPQQNQTTTGYQSDDSISPEEANYQPTNVNINQQSNSQQPAPGDTTFDPYGGTSSTLTQQSQNNQPAQPPQNAKATHYLPGDKTYRYGKNSDGTWFGVRISDGKFYDLRNNSNAIQNLNSKAIIIGQKPKSGSVQQPADNINQNNNAAGAPEENEKLQAYNSAVQGAMNRKKAQQVLTSVFQEISKGNSDEQKIVNTIKTLSKPEFEELLKIKVPSGQRNPLTGKEIPDSFAERLSKALTTNNDKSEIDDLNTYLKTLGYEYVYDRGYRKYQIQPYKGLPYK
jgi:hypothetical protein